MRRLVTALAIACLVLGVLTPAQAEDPPPPETMEETPVGPGVICNAQRGRPFQEIFNSAAYVSSYFTIACRPVDDTWRITEVTADLLHRQGTGDGAWGPYSNDHAIKTRSGPGTLQFMPSRDRCNVGGAMRYYQQKVDVEVAEHAVPGGQTARYHHTYLATATYKRPCGAHEP